MYFNKLFDAKVFRSKLDSAWILVEITRNEEEYYILHIHRGMVDVAAHVIEYPENPKIIFYNTAYLSNEKRVLEILGKLLLERELEKESSKLPLETDYREFIDVMRGSMTVCYEEDP